ncbi:ABC transporter permease [Melissospora conviva]|uniref:ABC transporter permease n=1 Tax=Melissospora conviva TaxID=3388432 RepID=UPI003C1BB27D
MNAFAGTGMLTRIVLRRDRVRLGLWLLGVPLLGYALAVSVFGIYPDEAARRGYAVTSASSLVARAFNGPIGGAEMGAVVVAETYATAAVIVALLSTFAVVRHTRQNEETGRAELLGSSVVGRYALLTSALLVVVGVNVVATALLAVALIATGLPVTGCIAAAAAIGGVGLAFTAVAAVTAQLTVTSRGANALAAAAVGVAFLVRAAGDVFGDAAPDGTRVESAWPSWVSPLGWGNQVRAFAGERWWTLALPVALLIVAVGCAYALAQRRDVGAGLIASRRGPGQAAGWLRGPAGLAWRMQRGTLLGWAVGTAVFGFCLGVAADEFQAMISDNPAAADVIAAMGGGGRLVDTYFAAVLGLFALAFGAYVVQALLRIRADESEGVLEAVLATAVGRSRWLGTHLAAAALGALALLLVAGAGTGLGYGVVAGDIPGRVLALAGAAAVWLPALVVVAGVVIAFVGLLPRWSVGLSWAALLTFLLLGQIGTLLELPQLALDVSPFTHVPAVPATDADPVPLIFLLAVAGLLLSAGAAAFRHRDVPN